MARTYKARRQNKKNKKTPKTKKNSKRGAGFLDRRGPNGDIIEEGDRLSGIRSYSTALGKSILNAGGKNAQFLAILNNFDQQEFRTFKYNMIEMAGANPYDDRFKSFHPIPDQYKLSNSSNDNNNIQPAYKYVPSEEK